MSSSDDDEGEQRPRTSGSDGKRTKRRRTVSIDDGFLSLNMVSLDVMKAVISATGSAVASEVASAIRSSGREHAEEISMIDYERQANKVA